MSWLAVFIEGKREYEFAEKVEEKIGWETYVPTGKKTIRPRHARKNIIVRYPAFPNYCFVQEPEQEGQVYKLWQFPMLRYIVSADGTYLSIGGNIIESLRLAQERGMFDNLQPDARKAFPLGAMVLINKGHLIGRHGVVSMPANNGGFAVITVNGVKAKINVDFLHVMRQTPRRTSVGDPPRRSYAMSSDSAPGI